MISPSCRVEASTSRTSTRSPASKSVLLMESDSTINALYPNRFRSARSKVETDTTVKIIIPTASATTAHTSTLRRIFSAFIFSLLPILLQAQGQEFIHLLIIHAGRTVCLQGHIQPAEAALAELPAAPDIAPPPGDRRIARDAGVLSAQNTDIGFAFGQSSANV